MKKICAILAAAAAGLSAVMSSIPVIYADNPIILPKLCSCKEIRQPFHHKISVYLYLNKKQY